MKKILFGVLISCVANSAAMQKLLEPGPNDFRLTAITNRAEPPVIVVGDRGGAVTIINDKGTRLAHCCLGACIDALGMQPKGSLVVAADNNKKLHVVDTQDGLCKESTYLSQLVLRVVFVDESRCLVITQNGLVQEYSIQPGSNGQPQIRYVFSHDFGLTNLCKMPGGANGYQRLTNPTLLATTELPDPNNKRLLAAMLLGASVSYEQPKDNGAEREMLADASGQQFKAATRLGNGYLAGVDQNGWLFVWEPAKKGFMYEHNTGLDQPEKMCGIGEHGIAVINGNELVLHDRQEGTTQKIPLALQRQKVLAITASSDATQVLVLTPQALYTVPLPS